MTGMTTSRPVPKVITSIDDLTSDRSRELANKLRLDLLQIVIGAEGLRQKLVGNVDRDFGNMTGDELSTWYSEICASIILASEFSHHEQIRIRTGKPLDNILFLRRLPIYRIRILHRVAEAQRYVAVAELYEGWLDDIRANQEGKI